MDDLNGHHHHVRGLWWSWGYRDRPGTDECCWNYH